jgi:hypothetical protein
MKILQKLLFLGLMYQLSPSMLVAQSRTSLKQLTPEKPFLFARFPENFQCDEKSLHKLFNAEVDDQITFPLPGNQAFRGIVSTKVQRAPNVLSVNILSSNFPGTLLNLSLITQSDKSEKIIGRFLNPKNGDVLVIEQHEKKYYITRDLQKFVMSECPLPQTEHQEAGR